MELVIDANILFAALIKNSVTAEILFNENVYLFAPEFLLEEFIEHKEEIIKKMNRSLNEFDYILGLLKSLIKFVPREEFQRFLGEAEIVTPDKDDAPYFALALKLNIPIWSNDKKLKEQNKVKVYSTSEILSLLK